MILASIALLLTAAASSSPYPGFDPLSSSDDHQLACSDADDLCVEISEPDVVTVERGDKEIGRWTVDTEGDSDTVEPMPAMIPLTGGRLLIGALVTRQTSYSGGGGSATKQLLALVEPGKPIKTLLTLPESGMLSLRACFFESQYKRRAGACEADFRFSGSLSADRSDRQHLPALHFRMEASHFPRGASRYDDSYTHNRIRKGDLIWEKDTRCTFERSFHFDAARGQYLPDTDLPDCTDYTDP